MFKDILIAVVPTRLMTGLPHHGVRPTQIWFQLAAARTMLQPTARGRSPTTSSTSTTMVVKKSFMKTSGHTLSTSSSLQFCSSFCSLWLYAVHATWCAADGVSNTSSFRHPSEAPATATRHNHLSLIMGVYNWNNESLIPRVFVIFNIINFQIGLQRPTCFMMQLDLQGIFIYNNSLFLCTNGIMNS